jgi:hypothetical protein
MSYDVLFYSCDWTESENVNFKKICDEQLLTGVEVSSPKTINIK